LLAGPGPKTTKWEEKRGTRERAGPEGGRRSEVVRRIEEEIPKYAYAEARAESGRGGKTTGKCDNRLVRAERNEKRK
jgi:hypothetical protein